MNVRFSAVALTAALVAGCSGGTTTLPTTSTAPANGAVQPAAPAANTAFVIRIPAARSAASKLRAPQYLSPSTQSIAIAVDASTAPTIANLTPSSPGCVAATSVVPLTCTVGVNVLPGTHAFKLTTYDAANGKGNALSTNTLSGVVIASGVKNTVPVTLNGIVAGVVLTLATTNPAVGSPATIALSVTAKDADGNAIIGAAPYTSPIALTNSDASGATTLSATSVTSPTTAVTVTYNGSASLVSATISGTVSGVPASAITAAVLTPLRKTASSGGAEALAVYSVGSTTYAAVPLASSVATVPIASGTTISATRRSVAVAARRPLATKSFASYSSRASYLSAQQSAVRTLRASRTTLATSPTIPLTSGADECSLGSLGSTPALYCISFQSSVVQVVNLTTSAQVASYTTDAPSNGVTFSGVTCTICGIVYDGKDSSFIISTANGYETFNAATGAAIGTIAAPISENFGYDPVADRIFSAYYGNGTGMDIIPLPGGSPLTLTPLPASLDEPDSAAIDSTTGIAASPEEFISGSAQTLYLVNLGQQTVSGTSVAAPTATVSLASSLAALNSLIASDVAVDSPSHLAFLGAEFSNPGIIGVAQLPSSSSAPLAIGDYTFATLPSTPDTNPFAFYGDPHATATYELGTGASAQVLGITYDATQTWVAVINMQKLLAAPRSASDPHLTDPSYDLVANGVVSYIAI